jgi:hypothetical protein
VGTHTDAVDVIRGRYTSSCPFLKAIMHAQNARTKNDTMICENHVAHWMLKWH